MNFEIEKPVRIGIYILAVLCAIFNFMGLKTGLIVRIAIFNSFSIASLIWGVAVFMAIYYFFKDKTVKTRFLEEIAKLSFGVYILHVLVLELFVRYILPYEHFVPQKPVLYVTITFIGVGAVSLIVSYFLSHIKGLNTIIRYKRN